MEIKEVEGTKVYGLCCPSESKRGWGRSFFKEAIVTPGYGRVLNELDELKNEFQFELSS